MIEACVLWLLVVDILILCGYGSYCLWNPESIISNIFVNFPSGALPAAQIFARIIG
jgi:hypothetical protein